MSQPITLEADKVRKALTFFRIMAFVVGIGLLILVVEAVGYLAEGLTDAVRARRARMRGE